MLLLGLQDDYSHDGRALVEDLGVDALPRAVRRSLLNFAVLATAYKKINAPVGPLGLATLGISTKALAGDDTAYNFLENGLSTLTTQRNALASQMIQQLEAAEFGGQPVDSSTTLKLVRQAQQLLHKVSDE
jgi:hypothetical protein